MSKKRMTFIESVTAHEPEINVINKDIMDDRIALVFNQIASTLQKSLGPVGAHAIISQAPNYHVTKDGFTIMKNIRYNSEYGYVDNVISGMISDICGRLNFAVGDGTTSAVLSANAMYQSFNSAQDEIKKMFFLPRNVLTRMKELTDIIVKRLSNYAVDIRSLPVDEMCEYIRQVVYVSSNADVEMTDTIVNLYKEIGFPAISVVKAADGITKGKVVEGFMFHAKLMDRLYINSDDNCQRGKDYDIVILDHKVTLNFYKKFLHTLAFMSKIRGRKLICIAPNYDEVALQGDILNDLNAEYRNTKDISLVLMGYRATRNSDRKRIQDLAMLCNTQVITQSVENELIKRIDILLNNPEYSGNIQQFLEFINLDSRDIDGIKVVDSSNIIVEYYQGFKPLVQLNEEDFTFRVGFCGAADLYVDKDSIFTDFRFNETLYERYLADAKKELDDTIEKYKRLGTFNFETDDAQRRYLGLKLKMGTIEVGSTTDFSQEFLIDAMDDAVKAAESAYRNGVILGCHTSLLKAIRDEIYNKERSEGDKFLLQSMFNAFRFVRSCVLENGFEDSMIDITELRSIDDLILVISKGLEINVRFMEDESLFDDFFEELHSNFFNNMKLFDLINEVEIYTGTTLNLDMGDTSDPHIEFNKKVINSAATDREILIASSDLVSLLTTGNQLVISRGNYGM